MQALVGSVGTGGTNNASDVALVQAILVKTLRPSAADRTATAYLASYDGVFGPGTADAIIAFQNEHVFVGADGRTSAPNARATAALVAPGDATWTKMCSTVAAGFENLRVLPTGRTVYLEATTAARNAKLAAAGRLVFTELFAQRVANTINRMYADHGIAIGVCPQGDRRTFAAQYTLRTSGRNVTNAGPGESNHNFGMAVDLGFSGLRWLRPVGTVVETETDWLHILDAQGRAAEPNAFWAALRHSGEAIGIFRGPVGDRPHLQNWADAGVSMAARLAGLLTLSGTMRWSGQRGGYSCDLGFGGALVPVGSSVQIWAREAIVSIPELQRLRTAAAAVGPGRPGGPPGARPGAARPPAAQPPHGARQGAAGPVAQADVVAMQLELRRQFDLADANWRSWTPS